MKLREIAASFIQPEMEDIMTLQQKKERAIRLKLISALSLCLFFLLWYLVTDVLKLAPATLFPSPVTALKTGIAKWTTKKAGWGYAPHPHLLQPARLPAGLLLRRVYRRAARRRDGLVGTHGHDAPPRV